MVSHSGEIVTLDPNKGVLILIVMDNGLSRLHPACKGSQGRVLILIVMDNGLSLFEMKDYFSVGVS